MEQFIFYYVVAELIGIAILIKFKVKRDRLYWVQFAVLAALAVASAISKGVQARKQRKAAEAINPDDPTYVADPNIAANQGLASTLFNGRMAGATDLERNIQASQAGTFGQINRNATSGSQALALAAATQGQTNNSLQQLQVQEKQNKYALAQQLYSANTAMAGENYKVYADRVRKNDNDVQAKVALQQAAANNRSAAWSDLVTAAGAGAQAAGGAQQAGVFGSGGSNISSANVTNMQQSPYPWMNANTGNIAAPGQQIPQVQPYLTSNSNGLYFNSLTGKWQR